MENNGGFIHQSVFSLNTPSSVCEKKVQQKPSKVIHYNKSKNSAKNRLAIYYAIRYKAQVVCYTVP